MLPAVTWRRAAPMPSLSANSASRVVARVHEFLLDLHRGQQGLAHRFDRHVLDDVQHRELGARQRGEVARARADPLALVAEVHDQQDPAVLAHGRHYSAARLANSAGASVSGRRLGVDAGRGELPRRRRGRAANS